MTFATPLGLLALVAIPVIVAIHLFRRRFPVRPIAGLFLWEAMRQTPAEGRRLTKLPLTRSLVLECLAALALALILAGARLSSGGVDRHLVVLLDDTASMAAIDSRGESARDRTVRRVVGEIDRLGARARVTLVVSGERPTVLAGPAGYAVEARTALEKWQPGGPDHSLALGIRLARELAGRTGTVMVLSDRPPSARGQGEVAGALWVAVGEPLANVGILAAERTISPEEGRGTVLLTLGNLSDSVARRSVTITPAGSKSPGLQEDEAAATSPGRREQPGSGVRDTVPSPVVQETDIDVPPGTSSITLPIPPALPTVQVALSDDALRRDNRVVLAEPRPQIVGVENRLREGRGRDALGKALEAVSGATRAESGHLAFVDARELDAAPSPGLWRAGFGRPPDKWVANPQPRDFVGPFVLEKRHPLLLGVTLGGVVWAGAMPLAPGALGPLVSAGDQALLGTPAAGATRTEPVFLFNLDLDRTNLIRSPDWPILVSNLVEMRRQALPGPQRWNYRVGEWVRVRLGREPKAQLKYRCGSVERTLPAGRQLEFIAPTPGGVLQIIEGEELLFELGVNFMDEAESDLRQASTADSGELAQVAGLDAEAGPSSDPLFWILLAGAGTAILLNWVLLSPARRRA